MNFAGNDDNFLMSKFFGGTETEIQGISNVEN